MTKKMCLALARKWDSASDTVIVWAKSARGVWGSGGGKHCFGDVPSGRQKTAAHNQEGEGLYPPAHPRLCESNTLVRATVGVSATFGTKSCFAPKRYALCHSNGTCCFCQTLGLWCCSCKGFGEVWGGGVMA